MKTFAVIAMVVVCACGKSASKDPAKTDPAKTDPAKTDPAKTPNGPNPSGDRRATGSVTLGGELVGTFEPKDDLTIELCTWNDGIVEVQLTLSDAARDVAINLDGSKTGADTLVNVTSGALNADHYLQHAGGVSLTSTDNGAHITAQFDAIAKHDAKTETIKGTLQFSCPR
jgi:hypothetical protein